MIWLKMWPKKLFVSIQHNLEAHDHSLALRVLSLMGLGDSAFSKSHFCWHEVKSNHLSHSADSLNVAGNSGSGGQFRQCNTGVT